jgi:hypothetical protein
MIGGKHNNSNLVNIIKSNCFCDFRQVFFRRHIMFVYLLLNSNIISFSSIENVYNKNNPNVFYFESISRKYKYKLIK